MFSVDVAGHPKTRSSRRLRAVQRRGRPCLPQREGPRGLHVGAGPHRRREAGDPARRTRQVPGTDDTRPSRPTPSRPEPSSRDRPLRRPALPRPGRRRARDPPAAAPTMIGSWSHPAPVSQSAEEAVLNTVQCGFGTRGGPRFHCTCAPKSWRRWIRTHGGWTRRRSRSTITWTGRSEESRRPGPSAARRAEEWLSAAGQENSTEPRRVATRSARRCGRRRSPFMTGAHSRRRSVRTTSWSAQPRDHQLSPRDDTSLLVEEFVDGGHSRIVAMARR